MGHRNIKLVDTYQQVVFKKQQSGSRVLYRSTPLSYIFHALFRDTPLGHVRRMQPISQIAKLVKYLDIPIIMGASMAGLVDDISQQFLCLYSH